MSDALLEADVVIIGSGVAGAMMACKLAKQGIKVLMLEAGPRIERQKIVEAFTKTAQLDLSSGFPNAPWAPRPDWNAKDGQPVEFTGPEIAKMEYLRVVGGTTWHWSARTPRFMPVEMRMKSAYGVGADWPIDYATLEPFYAEAEKEMGISGDSTVDDGSPRSTPFPLPPIPKNYADTIFTRELKKIGIPFHAPPAARNSRPYQDRSQCMGFGTCSPICPSGAQYSAMVHVEMAEKAGARVLANARVDRLEADESGKVVAAKVGRPDGSSFRVRGRIFVLAMGGIDTPRLLLMSADTHHGQGLANSSGQVGRNYTEHLGIIIQMLMPMPVYPGRGPQNTIISYSFRDGEFRNKRAGWLLAPFGAVRYHDIANGYLLKGVEPPALDKAIRDRILREVEFESQMEQLPLPENGITLNWDKRDSAGQPCMRLYYSFSDYERHGLAHIRETLQRIVTALDAETLGMSDPFIRHHMMGMTRMGFDAKTSVVDAHCRAHDHPNLFMVSASVFPTGGTANPTLTIAALSLRAAGDIAQQVRA